ncbi:serine hydrolase domain-containing protein [Spirosoma aerolatum]|uniref:serine hydrolase domain-containing protein n=1 Tax=Spirosoma aerolatum TaxID=1211326 RepID=UPI0009AEBC01|nr:serine hydrolase domain-containing protein [Spirosoma aerolatum]
MQPHQLQSSYWLFTLQNGFGIACFTLLISLLFIYQLPTVAQPTTQRLDSLFTGLQNEQRLNGNVLLAEQGKIVYQKSFGFARVNDKLLNRNETRFQLASIGKTFTAVAILQLYEQGKIKLDDPLINYLPDFPFTTITIRQLLSHTFGLADLQIFEPYFLENPKRILTNADVIPALKRFGKLQFEPGERWEGGPDYGAARFLIAKADTTQYSFSPAELDYAGRQFLLHGDTNQALETLKLLTFTEPQAWQPYNSYAEILQQSGKRAEAILMYQKSLRLNADNNRLKQVLNELLNKK